MSLLELAGDEAERQGGGRVVVIHLRLGPLSGVVSEALMSAFEMARKGTPMHECKLLIEQTPIVLRCARCEGPRPARGLAEICCSECGTPSMEVLTGRELELFALELSDEPERVAATEPPTQ